MTPSFSFDNRYARLPERFHARRAPTPVESPGLIKVNRGLAELLGIDPDALASPEGVAVLAGNRVPEGSEPIALAYAGHQFGHFVPQLGDGRAILMGEIVARDGRRYDLQWKGSGRTPFSRGGDGRAALGPVLREYLVCEAMHALGVPTTRTLGAVTTGDYVMREAPLPGAVLVRVASSHLRVGTFQFFAARGDVDGLRLLAEHARSLHEPEAFDSEHPFRALLDGVVKRQAELVARWLGLGFIHGVMNTDNCAISGETLDYGPCAFMDAFHPAKVFSSIDRQGRYAFSQQPRIAGWNLARLAEAMLPILADSESAAVEAAQTSLDRFGGAFDDAYAVVARRKLGLFEARAGDAELYGALLACMADAGADFTLTFRSLARAAEDDATLAELRATFGSPAVTEWLERWRLRLADERPIPAAERAAAMRAVNPAYIPRNHQVELAIRAAMSGDLEPFHELVDVLARPYDEQPGKERFALAPRPEERVTQTFCGT
ncbi:MAG: YdiU family protein [Deltaproteobacteria bacterium]|nr:YdiU family protein [Deltaproteobacteria bacterium]